MVICFSCNLDEGYETNLMLILTSIFYIIDQPSTVEQARSASALECPILNFCSSWFPCEFSTSYKFRCRPADF